MLTKTDLAHAVAASQAARRAQGLGPTITDEATLAKFATLLATRTGAPPKRRSPDRTMTGSRPQRRAKRGQS